MNEEIYHWLGKRDGYAEVLALTNKQIKLPEIANIYQKLAGEKHFSHDWHTE